jgi:hypothetical protein
MRRQRLRHVGGEILDRRQEKMVLVGRQRLGDGGRQLGKFRQVEIAGPRGEGGGGLRCERGERLETQVPREAGEHGGHVRRCQFGDRQTQPPLALREGRGLLDGEGLGTRGVIAGPAAQTVDADAQQHREDKGSAERWSHEGRCLREGSTWRPVSTTVFSIRSRVIRRQEVPTGRCGVDPPAVGPVSRVRSAEAMATLQPARPGLSVGLVCRPDLTPGAECRSPAGAKTP